MADLQQQRAETLPTNLFDLLSSYGINIKENIVTDLQAQSINVQEQRGSRRYQTQMKYPPLILSNNINKEHPIVAQLDNFQFVFASEIDTSSVADGISVTPLIMSSRNSGSIDGPYYNIGIQQFQDKNHIDKLTSPAKILSAIYSGSFNSFFSDDDKPKKSDSNSNIIYVSDSEFINMGGRGEGTSSNQTFVLNSIDFLVGDAALVKLRSREVQHTPIKLENLVDIEGLTPSRVEAEVNKARKTIKSVNFVLPSLLLLLLGLLKYRLEIKRRKRISEIYE